MLERVKKHMKIRIDLLVAKIGQCENTHNR